MREVNGSRNCESSTMRSSGRRRGRLAAIGEQRIVGQHSANAGEQRVVRMAKLLHACCAMLGR